MKKLKNYLHEAYIELKEKVTWPTRQELQASAVVVLVASFIIALLVSIMDLAFSNVMQGIYKLFY
jgi:preprotein translocase subunit SecE